MKNSFNLLYVLILAVMTVGLFIYFGKEKTIKSELKQTTLSYVISPTQEYYMDSVSVMVNDRVVPITYNKDHSIFSINYYFEKNDTVKLKVTFSKLKE